MMPNDIAPVPIEVLAYHEAGHAVVGLAVRVPLEAVNMYPEPDFKSAARVVFGEPEKAPKQGTWVDLSRLIACVAGGEAHRLAAAKGLLPSLNGMEPPGIDSDDLIATEMPLRKGGIHVEFGEAMVRAAKDEATRQVENCWAGIKAVADLLIARGGTTVPGEEVKRISDVAFIRQDDERLGRSK
jgi:hypothetical protein